jgi:hypothetical protein
MTKARCVSAFLQTRRSDWDHHVVVSLVPAYADATLRESPSHATPSGKSSCFLRELILLDGMLSHAHCHHYHWKSFI